VQQQAQPQVIIYPFPSGAFYIDRVEFPTGLWPKSFVKYLDRKSPLIAEPEWDISPNNGMAPEVAFGAGGGLSAGAYTWAFTYTVPGDGETTSSPPVRAVATLGQQATLGGLPIGPYGVTGRNIYRTPAGGGQLKLVSSVQDNVSSIFVDSLPDAGLGASIPVVNTTANLDQVELQLPPELWPADSTRLLEIDYAVKQHLDIDGTTVPERHWDCLYVGAVAFAMFSYLPQVNDNFDYVDGHLRDRVDDTKSTLAWQAQCQLAMADFERQLLYIKEESNSGITGLARWGDVPLRWERL
ncbi:MAG: hypothetical protein ACRDFX_11325, partial [Chloroflexota bacterium]